MDRVLGISISGFSAGALPIPAASGGGATGPAATSLRPSSSRTRHPVVLRAPIGSPAVATGAARTASPATGTASLATAAPTATAHSTPSAAQSTPAAVLVTRLAIPANSEAFYRSNIAVLRRAVAAYNAIMAIFIG